MCHSKVRLATCLCSRLERIDQPFDAALNTLDLLKKGTSALAQRARAASRILEAQVGTNPRIRVQQDDAFVPWDAIPFSALNVTPATSTTAPTSTSESTTLPTTSPATALADAPDASPEWVRRTVCCARWELDNAAATEDKDKDETAPPRTVRLAVLSSVTPPTSTADGGALSKHEPRAMGTLVSHWAARGGITVLPIAPSTHAPNANPGPSNGGTTPTTADPPRRPRAGTQTKRGGGSGGAGSGPKGGLVERPPAALAMEVSPRVVRVLARGERLDAGA